MKKGIVLPTNEMRDNMATFNGTCIEETPPNGLNGLRISKMAFDAVFEHQPDIQKNIEQKEVK